MSEKIVFDASAILVLLKMEIGHELVAAKLDQAIVSSVNFSEVLTVLARKGFGQKHITDSLKQTFLYIEDFTKEQAIIAATLDKFTQSNGLSFGDRACLSLAKSLNLPVLTADQVWKNLNIGVNVQLVR